MKPNNRCVLHTTKHDHVLSRPKANTLANRVALIVCLCKPQSKLPKLTFQWSEPTFIITSVSPSVLRNLVVGEDNKLPQAGKLKDTVVNRKMTSLYPVPHWMTSLYPVPNSFFIGAIKNQKGLVCVRER